MYTKGSFEKDKNQHQNLNDIQKKSTGGKFKKNNTTNGPITKSNAVKKILEKQKVVIDISPESKLEKILQSSNKKPLNLQSPKNISSNYLNFTKRSNNIKQVLANTISNNELSKENFPGNQNKIPDSSKSALKEGMSKSIFTKISSSVNKTANVHSLESKNSKKNIFDGQFGTKNNNETNKKPTLNTLDSSSNKQNNLPNSTQNKSSKYVEVKLKTHLTAFKFNKSVVKNLNNSSNSVTNTNAFSSQNNNININEKLVLNFAKNSISVEKKKANSNVSSINSKVNTLESSSRATHQIHLKIGQNDSKEKEKTKYTSSSVNPPIKSNNINVKSVVVEILKKDKEEVIPKESKLKIPLNNKETEKNLASKKKLDSSKKEVKEVKRIPQPTKINSSNIFSKTIEKSLSPPKKISPRRETKLELGTGLINNVSILVEDYMTSEFVLEKYSNKLSEFEINEIKNLSEIYYLGKIEKEEEKDITTKSNGGINQKSIGCYDDENGNYIVIKGDHINYRFEIISELGKGSFGQALKCYDHKFKKKTCVKIIRNDEKFTKQALIEIKILEYIKNNDQERKSNIIRIIDHFMFRNHMCITFELLDINLYEFLKKNNFGLSIPLIKSIGFQLFTTVSFLQKHNIIHCDLKPENIILTDSSKSSTIKVIDFGSSCFDSEKLYAYIQSRYYRAPEIILGLGYNPQIDMWSVGCILAELHLGIPIFPGENEFDQLNYIMEFFGVPPKYIILSAKKKHLFFDQDLNPIKKANSKGKIRKPNTKDIDELLEEADEGLIDLIKKCLVWDPFKRIKPDEALNHKWFNEFYNRKSQKYLSKANENQNSQSNLFDKDKKKSNFLKYKGQINKLSNAKQQIKNQTKTLINSTLSREEHLINYTK